MNKAEFIEAIKVVVEKSSIENTLNILQHVPGRNPSPQLIARSDWYTNLSSEDKLMVQSIIREAVEDSVFGFLCMLDGVRAIEGAADKGELQLIYRKGESQVLLNDPDEEDLHDIYIGQ
jgi:hypothetical protein